MTNLASISNAVKEFEGILLMCASCKKINEPSGSWMDVADFMHQNFHLVFTHGICSECLKNLYPEFYAQETKEGKSKKTKNKINT